MNASTGTATCQEERTSALRLGHVFSDHAVLQREMPVPVWGWTAPGVRVHVKLGPHEAMTRSAGDGKFLARLPPMPAGGPYEMDVSTPDPDARARITDVMVGEVWVCSGQSNMEWPVRETGFDPESPCGADARVRSLKVPPRALLGRQADIDGCWRAATPRTVKDFTAVGFAFGRRLARELDVAVGLIDASWGGTRIEAWISREALVRHERTSGEVARYEALVSGVRYWRRFDPFEPDSPEAATELIAETYPRDPGNVGFGNRWAEPEFDDTGWETVEEPGSWKIRGHDTNGVFWFRRAVAIPDAWAGKDLTLGVGAVDKQDTTYFNGEQVGATGRGFEDQHWCVPRFYTVPGRLVRGGRAVIAVRAYSFVYDGGLIGPKDKMAVGPADGSAEPIRLAGVWRMRIEHDFGPIRTAALAMSFGPGNPQSPYMLNDSMIQPLIPYAIRGAAWYQGESNEADGLAYGSSLRALIRDWRHAWGQGDFPFLTVQLANFRQPSSYDDSALWPRLREAQLKSLLEPNTGLAVAIDIGEEADIHPRNKQDVGFRLAQWALARTYGKAVVPSGPLYRDFAVEGDRIRLRFDHVGAGLMAREGALRTFVVAGPDKEFVAAQAEIEGDTVVVRSPRVAEPVAARYAWADNPDRCNLYNRDGLPASPFRTDRW
ncbi:MAG: 9-O-acetylesterase [Lentisphaerae bacterium]|nr:9-O-acetylesterase [Lentisphaerota bacterium]